VGGDIRKGSSKKSYAEGEGSGRQARELCQLVTRSSKREGRNKKGRKKDIERKKLFMRKRRRRGKEGGDTGTRKHHRCREMKHKGGLGCRRKREEGVYQARMGGPLEKLGRGIVNRERKSKK